MSAQVEKALQYLQNLGDVRGMEKLASSGYAPARQPLVNTHVHLPPNFSAFTTVQQAVELARQQNVGVLGISNYYDYEVYGEFAALSRQYQIFPLFGLEIICMIDQLRDAGIRINDPGNPGKMYICGKGISRFSRMTAEATRLLGLIRANDSTRMEQMVQATERVLASRGLPTGMTAEKVINMIVRRHGSPRHTVYLQERHIAQAFQEAIFAKVPAEQLPQQLHRLFGTRINSTDPVSVQNDLRTHLLKAGKPAFVQETFISFTDAYRLILELGGYPCYPVLADSCSPMCEFEQTLEKLIHSIRQWNIHAVEFITVRNSVQCLSKYVLAMRSAGLAVTAGTEHNTLDLIPMAPACKDGVPLPQELKDIFWEGACVAAAHQFLTLHGLTGFVDEFGHPHPQYQTADQRIRAMAALGAAVIERYYQSTKP